MKIALGSDHAGYDLKKEVVSFLRKERHEFEDIGVFTEESADYPDIGVKVAEAVANKEFDRGILICGTGIGMSITANKVPGIRAALCVDPYSAMLSRDHNDANVLVLGGRITDMATALEIVRTWLTMEFPAQDRHVRRLHKIGEIERKYYGGGS